MNALSKLFETLHLSRRETASRRSHRRRRTRQHRSYLSCETLEPKQLLAADVGVQFDDIVLETTDPSTVAIEGRFEESKVSSGTIVRFETNAPLSDPSFYVELTDNTPKTNENFLSYVDSGAYDDSIFHRSVDNFVIQGGGFSAPLVDANRPGSDPVSIPTTGTVDNEPFNSNDRGTIAMAKLGGQPDSATSQFFFNLSDNDFLNSDNGGYTQFGSVLGSGMTVVDTLGTATVWRADQYYANTAMQELPLWNLNADNIVTPNDFVKINNVEVATETDSDLFTYEVSSSDAAKLTASFDGNGDLVLTPVGDAAGSVDVTVTATSKLDNSTASDTFSVQLDGGGLVFTPIESAGNTILNRDQDGKLYAGNSPIYNGETHLTVNPYAGHTVVAIEDLGTDGKKLVMQTSTQIVIWTLDADWKRELSAPAERLYLTRTSTVETEETRFGVDFNGGGIGSQAPVLSDLETAGSTALQRDADGKLYADGAPIYNTYNGETHLTVNPYAGHTVVAIEDLGTDGKKLVMQTSTQIVIWTLDADWKRELSAPAERLYLTRTSTVETEETRFGVDFNGGGIGSQAPVLSDLETAGSTALQRDADGKLYADGAPIYNTHNGETHLSVNPYAGHTVVAIEDLGADGKKLVMQTSTQIVIWTLDADWKRDVSVTAERIDLIDTATVEENEFWFETDFNGGGVSQFLNLETAGSTALQRDADGKLYADGAPIYNTHNGETHLSVNPYAGHTVVAIEDLGADGKKLVMQTSTQIVIWTLDASWKRDLSAAAQRIYLNSTSTVETEETSFGVDFNGGGIGSQAPVLSDLETAGSTDLQRDQFGRLYADGNAIYNTHRGESHLTITPYAGHTVVAVEDLGIDGKRLLLKTNTQIVIWTLDADWKRDLAISTERHYLTDSTTITNYESVFDVTI